VPSDYSRVVRRRNVVMREGVRHILIHKCVGEIEDFKLLRHEDAGKP
jgi:hypothetical protein